MTTSTQPADPASLAFLDFGKRDVAYDADLPRPLHWAQPGPQVQPRPAPGNWTIASLYDQHARLELPPGAELAAGDLLT